MGESKLEVKLVAHTPNPEHLIADNARLCYANNENAEKLFGKERDSKDDARMIKILADMKHMSPFEHVNYSFEITGISRVTSHQLVRHRLASYSQRSQRYVKHDKEFQYIVPPSIKEAELTERYLEMMKTIRKFYEELSLGLEKSGIQGEEKNQDARYVLPNACETKIGVTMNARELLHFFQERLCNRAQWEIRKMAEKMFELVYPTAPNVFSYAGPSCVSEGRCHQGKKGCGKMKEKNEYFEKIKNL